MSFSMAQLMSKIGRIIERTLIACLIFMALAILWNVVTEYVIPEMKSGDISWNPIKD